MHYIERNNENISVNLHNYNYIKNKLYYKNEVLLDMKECTLNDVLDKLNEIDRTIDKAVKQINFRMVSKDDQ